MDFKIDFYIFLLLEQKVSLLWQYCFDFNFTNKNKNKLPTFLDRFRICDPKVSDGIYWSSCEPETWPQKLNHLTNICNGGPTFDYSCIFQKCGVSFQYFYSDMFISSLLLINYNFHAYNMTTKNATHDMET